MNITSFSIDKENSIIFSAVVDSISITGNTFFYEGEWHFHVCTDEDDFSICTGLIGSIESNDIESVKSTIESRYAECGLYEDLSYVMFENFNL